MSSEQTLELLDQRLALSAYFDAMLTPVEMPTQAPALTVVTTAPVTEVEPAPAVVVEVSPEQTPAVAAPIRPSWAEGPFQVLMFKVAGIQLALPLVKLSGVIVMSDELCPMPGHADWFMGVLPHLGRQVKVVDTGHLILPENRRGRYEVGNASHIVLIDDMRWGLACESIGEMVSLDPEQVRWRSEQGTRPWLAGTVIDRLCAVLSTDALAQQLLLGHK